VSFALSGQENVVRLAAAFARASLPSVNPAVLSPFSHTVLSLLTPAFLLLLHRLSLSRQMGWSPLSSGTETTPALNQPPKLVSQRLGLHRCSCSAFWFHARACMNKGIYGNCSERWKSFFEAGDRSSSRYVIDAVELRLLLSALMLYHFSQCVDEPAIRSARHVAQNILTVPPITVSLFSFCNQPILQLNRLSIFCSVRNQHMPS
jgi:hypothetical protein